ncbi:MAG: adenine phosphoribosyltransferase [Planctomycetota bacterium]
MELAPFIRDIPDFPKLGIIFKDITPLLADPAGLKDTVEQLIAPFENEGIEIVTGVESRGFIFAAAAAIRLGAGFVPIRKPGKLPADTIAESYELEYGTDTIEIHSDAIAPGQKVLMLDDLLATGGTMSAACELVKKIGGEIVSSGFVIELGFLNGRDKLECPVHSLMVVE